jgi:hypothetical protein
MEFIEKVETLKVIKIEYLKGTGVKENIYRRATQYWTLDGKFLWENDSLDKIKREAETWALENEQLEEKEEKEEKPRKVYLVFYSSSYSDTRYFISDTEYFIDVSWEVGDNLAEKYGADYNLTLMGKYYTKEEAEERLNELIINKKRNGVEDK